MAEFKRVIQRTTNSERIESGVAQLEVNEFCIVEDGEEVIYKNKDGEYVSISKDKYTVGTIEELKSSKKYKVGDVVQVLGYYTPGDGGGHPRKACLEDDGSGVQGSNKIWWNIVYNREVNISWFGAKDSESDLTKFIPFFGTTSLGIYFDSDCKFTQNLFLDGAKVRGINKHIYFENSGIVCDNKKWHSYIKDVALIGNGVGTAITWNGGGKRSYIEGVYIQGFENGIIGTNCWQNYFSKISTELITGTSIDLTSSYSTKIESVKLSGSNNPNTIGIKIQGGAGTELDSIDVSYFGTGLKLYHATTVKIDSLYAEVNINSIEFTSCNKVEINNAKIHSSVHSLNFIDINQLTLRNIKDDSENISIVGDRYNILHLENTNYTLEHFKSGNITNGDLVFSSYGNSSRYRDGLLIESDISYLQNVVGQKKYAGVGIYKNAFANVPSAVYMPLIALDSTATLSNPKYIIRLNTTLGCATYVCSNTESKLLEGDPNVFKTTNVYAENIIGVFPTSTLIQVRSGSIYSLSYEVSIIENMDMHTTIINLLTKLDTPYYAYQMQKQGIYKDYVAYMDELHEYRYQQREIEKQKQLAYEEVLKENPNLTYEEFLENLPMLLPILEEPQPSEALIAFKEKYIG